MFERAVFYVLTAIVMAYITFEVIELLYHIGIALWEDDPDQRELFFTKEQMAATLPVFFNVLIAVELMETLKGYMAQHHIQVQSILLIGLMAVGRKLLILDLGHADPLNNLGLAALILALALGYYFVRKPELKP
jgi:uncharacterized membrane protein (DUF373 family)